MQIDDVRRQSRVASENSAASSCREAAYALALLTTIYTLGYADRSVISLVLEPIRREFQLSDTVMGLITGFGFTAFQTLLAIPVARLADRSRRVVILTIGLLLWSVMTGLSGLATGALMLAVTRIGVGIGEACLTGPAHSLLADFYQKDKRPRAFSIMGSGGEIGVVLAFLVGGWVSHIWGWRAAFLVAGVPGVLVALMMHFTLREPPREAESGAHALIAPLPLGEALSELASRPSFLFAVCASMAMGLNIFGTTMWSPTYLRRVYHLDFASIGTTLAILRAVLSVSGALMGGSVVSFCGRRFGSQWFMLAPAIICAVSGLGLAGFLLAPSLPLSIACLGIVNMAVGAQLGPVFSLVQTISPVRSRGLAAAIFVSVTQLFGAGIGSLLIGVVSDAFHNTLGESALRYAMIIPVLGALIGAILYAFGSRYLVADMGRPEVRPAHEC